MHKYLKHMPNVYAPLRWMSSIICVFLCLAVRERAAPFRSMHRGRRPPACRRSDDSRVWRPATATPASRSRRFHLAGLDKAVDVVPAHAVTRVAGVALDVDHHGRQVAAADGAGGGLAIGRQLHAGLAVRQPALSAWRGSCAVPGPPTGGQLVMFTGTPSFASMDVNSRRPSPTRLQVPTPD